MLENILKRLYRLNVIFYLYATQYDRLQFCVSILDDKLCVDKY